MKKKDAEPDQAALRSIRRDLARAGARDGIFRVPFDEVAEWSRVRRERLDGLAESLGFQTSRVTYGG
ncbi:MAG: hypothetical protein ACLQVF_42865 [Isosphaeraceae bacterium]